MKTLLSEVIAAGNALHNPEGYLQPGLDVLYEPRSIADATMGWKARYLTDGTDNADAEAFIPGNPEDGPERALRELARVLLAALSGRVEASTLARDRLVAAMVKYDTAEADAEDAAR